MRVFSFLLLTIAALPAVFARSYHTGISPLNKVIETMSWMVNVPILQNEYVQIGFIRFGLFLVFLAVSHWVFKKLFDSNKTSGVIAAAFSIIAAFLMPEELVIVQGGVITVVFAGMIPLALVAGGIWFAVSEEKGLNKNFPLRIIALVLLFILLYIVEIYQQFLNLAPIILFIPVSMLRNRWRRR